VHSKPPFHLPWFGLVGLFFEIACIPVSVLAQEHAAFDAVAIKRAESGPLYPQLDIDPGYLSARAASLHFLILQAFGIEEFQLINTAPWMKSDLYSIHAAAGKRVSSSEMMVMLRDLLSSRFHLIFHRETQELPVYALTVDKSGAKLVPLTDVNSSQLQSTTRGNMTTKPVGSSVQELVHYLNSRTGSAALGLPVVDQTGLQGLYRIRLTFEDTHPDPDIKGGKLIIDYFAELPRQLGLRLKQTKAPINVLIVDSAQKPELDH
jgi:uncharacterized protein (TIGR03435 family)